MHHSSQKMLLDSPDSGPYSTLDDQALMALVVAGNHDAFAALVSRHTSRSLGLARRTLNNMADAEDVVQAVFIKIWQKPLSWQAGKSAFTTWLYRVVLNACVDLHRTSGPPVYDIDKVSEPQTADVLEQLSESDQSKRRNDLLMQAINGLPDSQRDAINLAVYGGLPQRQVAEVLGVSVKAVESLLVRAKTKLRRSIKSRQKIIDSDSGDSQFGGKL